MERTNKRRRWDIRYCPNSVKWILAVCGATRMNKELDDQLWKIHTITIQYNTITILLGIRFCCNTIKTKGTDLSPQNLPWLGSAAGDGKYIAVKGRVTLAKATLTLIQAGIFSLHSYDIFSRLILWKIRVRLLNQIRKSA